MAPVSAGAVLPWEAVPSMDTLKIMTLEALSFRILTHLFRHYCLPSLANSAWFFKECFRVWNTAP